MHDDIVVVEEDPAAVGHTLTAAKLVAVLGHLILDLVAECIHLTDVVRSRDHEIIRDDRHAADVHDGDILALLLLECSVDYLYHIL